MDPSCAFTEPIDLADVKSYLCMRDDDETQDPILTEAIKYCRDRLEAVLPYYLAGRTVICRFVNTPYTCDQVFVLKGPVMGVDRVKIIRRGQEEAVSSEDWTVFENTLYIHRRLGPNDLVWVEYLAGSLVPPCVKSALLMMVKNRYERADEDPLTPAVMGMVYNETRVNI